MSLLSTAMETSLWNPDHDWDVNQWRSRTFALPGRPGADHFPNELLQELEWRRCAQDPLWFLCRHWHVLTPDQGIVPFRPFDYQAHSIDVFQRRRLVLILKARQIGYTALVAGFCMWWAIFKPASTVLYLSLRQEDADKVVRAMRDHGLLQLPDWMQRRVWQTNRAGARIELSNASTLTTMPSQSNPARGQAASLIILDEWAFYANPEAAWASVGPAASVGGNVIALSSANGDGTPVLRSVAESSPTGNELGADVLRLVVTTGTHRRVVSPRNGGHAVMGGCAGASRFGERSVPPSRNGSVRPQMA